MQVTRFKSARLLIFILVLAAGLFSSGLRSALAQGRPLATITMARGTVEVRKPGNTTFHAVRIQATLHAGDVLRTGPTSGAAVLFADGTQLRLGAGASMEVTPPTAVRGKTSFFRILVGEVWSKLRPGRAVQTKYANLVVRGTEVAVEVTDTATLLTVLAGNVDFFNAAGTVNVGQGQQSQAVGDAAPTVPVTIANPGLTVEWRFDLDRTQIVRDRYFITASVPEARKKLANFQQPRKPGQPPVLSQAVARALHDAGQDTEALEIYRQQTLWLFQPETTREYAAVQAELGDFSGARTTLLDAIQKTTEPSKTALLSNALAWIELDQDNTAKAQEAVNQALRAVPNDAEALFIRALVNLRSGKNDLAKQDLAAAAGSTTTPTWGPPIAPQAMAWQALLNLSAGDTAAANKLANTAVQAAPQSTVTRTTSALVAFAANDLNRAAREASKATELNPNSVAGTLALAQAELARGNADRAGEAAAQAAALDEELPEAHYILGIADAARNDYPHAAESLRTALELNPGYAPAAAALARVQIRAGRPGDALKTLTDWRAKYPETPQVTAALGETYFRLARYDESLIEFRALAEKDPNSAQGWVGLARVALDANRLNEAIDAGQKAVALAPNIGEYHSILGLAYRYSRLEGQADREFRTALALDPQNALALVQLGYLQTDTDPLLTQRNTFVNSLQGFFLDPAVSRDLVRGGTNAFVDTSVGDRNAAALGGRISGAEGRINGFGQLFGLNTNLDRPNSDEDFLQGQGTLNLSPGKQTNIVLQATKQRQTEEIPGARGVVGADDDERTLRNTSRSIGVRQGLGDRSTLWLNLSSLAQTNLGLNPSADNSSVRFTSILFPSVPRSEDKTRALTPELRYDFALSSNRQHPSHLTLGYARPRTQTDIEIDLLARALPPTAPPYVGTLYDQRNSTSNLLYGQLNTNVGNRLSLAIQLRRQTIDLEQRQRLVFPFIGYDTGELTREEGHWLPSGSANYRLNRRTNLRLSASRRITDTSGSLLAPIDTLINTEPSTRITGYALPGGLGQISDVQLDMERYGSGGSLVKLFGFYSSGTNVIYDFSRYANTVETVPGRILNRNYLLFPKIRRAGAGLRLEKPVSRNVFAQLGATYASTRATGSIFTFNVPLEGPPLWSGEAAPYHPKWQGFAGLNYVNPQGVKLQWRSNLQGAFYQDQQNPRAIRRPRFGSKVTHDLLLAYEPSVRNEYFLQALNVFNSEQIVYNNVPYRPRQISVGWTHRF